MVLYGVPFLAASATLPPVIKSEIMLNLEYDHARTFEINLGNDRASLTLAVIDMNHACDLRNLRPAIQEGLDGGELVKMMIFFNTRELTYRAAHRLRELLPEEFHAQIDFLHAGRSRRARAQVLRRFRRGEIKIKILCATEAAGMVRRSHR